MPVCGHFILPLHLAHLEVSSNASINVILFTKNSKEIVNRHQYFISYNTYMSSTKPFEVYIFQ